MLAYSRIRRNRKRRVLFADGIIHSIKLGAVKACVDNLAPARNELILANSTKRIKVSSLKIDPVLLPVPLFARGPTMDSVCLDC